MAVYSCRWCGNGVIWSAAIPAQRGAGLCAGCYWRTVDGLPRNGVKANMVSMPFKCPASGQAVPHPAPEQMRCPKCKRGVNVEQIPNGFAIRAHQIFAKGER